MPTNKTTAKSAKARKATAKKTTGKRTASSKATARTATSKKVTRKEATTKTSRRASGRSGAPSRRTSSGALARPGDIIVIDSTQVGSPAREGEVLNVTVGEFSVRYQVRWGDGHETIISPLSAFFSTVYAGQSFNHRESGGTADAPDLGSGARKGVGVRLPPLARPLTSNRDPARCDTRKRDPASPCADQQQHACTAASCGRPAIDSRKVRREYDGVADPDTPYYRRDLALVHHLGFGFHADDCAPGILELLRPVRERDVGTRDA